MNLDRIINDWSGRQFDYGRSDCCQFAGAVIEAATGRNPAAAFQYVGVRGSLRAIAEHGSLRATASSVLGEPIDVEDSIEGDVLLGYRPNDGREIVGIRYQDRFVVKTAKSLTDWPLERAVCAWATWPRQ